MMMMIIIITYTNTCPFVWLGVLSTKPVCGMSRGDMECVACCLLKIALSQSSYDSDKMPIVVILVCICFTFYLFYCILHYFYF